MSAMASQVTGVSIVYSTVCSGADQGNHQSSASLAFVRGIHQWPVDSSPKGPVTQKCFHLMTSSFSVCIEGGVSMAADLASVHLKTVFCQMHRRGCMSVGNH